MDSSEKVLLAKLSLLRRMLTDSDPHWSSHLTEEVQKGKRIFSGGGTDVAKYEFLCELEGMYGGMGSLNDIRETRPIKKAREQLYACIEDLLRYYWKVLGLEHHDSSKFQLFPIGTEVKMVPGKTIIIESDNSRRVVPDEKWAKEQTWIIEAHDGPDITNMPLYSIKQGSKHMFIRHEAVIPLEMPSAD